MFVYILVVIATFATGSGAGVSVQTVNTFYDKSYCEQAGKSIENPNGNTNGAKIAWACVKGLKP